jgi:hypothetical protein
MYLKMNRYTLTFSVFLMSLTAFSQHLLSDIHKNKLADFVAFEEKLGYKPIANSSVHILQNGVAQPIEFRREQKGLPDLVAYYFFYKKDSAINYVLYQWDGCNFNDHKNISRKSSEQIKVFIYKYIQLYNLLCATYGKSITKGNLNDTSTIETGDFLKEDDWSTTDSSKIQFNKQCSC